MANIGIFCAGQSGLLLGKGLLKSGHDITIYSAETPQEHYSGRISSTQAMTPQTRDVERELNMNFWENELPPIKWFRFRLRSPNGKWFQFKGNLNSPAESVDQRLKFSRWMMYFEDIGCNLVFQRVETDDLPELEEIHDFIVVSTGKGELGYIFERNEDRYPYDEPMREIGLIQFRGVDPNPGTIDPDRVDFTVLAGLGECFPMPVRTTTLPNGTTATALRDAAITNDPVTGQGFNNATMHAWHDFQMMKEHEGPWDEESGNDVFEKHWEEYGTHDTRLTNMFLGKPPDHVIKLFAAENKAIGREIAIGWVNAPYFDPWLYDEDEAEKQIEKKTSHSAGALS